MKFNKKERRAHKLRRGHLSIQPDPDLFFGDHDAQHKPDYKTQALCKQALRVLAAVLAGECGDPALQDLAVDAVLPAPNAGRLMVLLRPGMLAGEHSTVELLTRLEQVHRLLRMRLAETIVRKRAPELVFQILACQVSS